MAKRTGRWVRVKPLEKEEKAAIAATCERFITDVLKPQFLPKVCPTEFNYPVDIFGKWRGSKYSFIVRYRSGFADNAGQEFNAPFCRFDHDEECLNETRFDVMWQRHTGQWLRMHSEATLCEALELVETHPILGPVL